MAKKEKKEEDIVEGRRHLCCLTDHSCFIQLK